MSLNDYKKAPQSATEPIELSDRVREAVRLFQALSEADQRHVLRLMDAMLATTR